MADIIKNLFLLALPASGKSEVRKFMLSLPEDEVARDLHIGPTVQLDDFPYVHFMRRVDEAMLSLGKGAISFKGANEPFADGRNWGALIELVNDDYADLVAGTKEMPADPVGTMIARFDRAREAVGMPALTGLLEEAGAVDAVREALQKEVVEFYEEKIANIPDSLEGKTVVIEFARGGPDGSSMPLAAPHGYAYSVPKMSPAFLEDAAALYIWVTPEESRRKNTERADPNDPGSILHHGVPMSVMLGEYGCDDMDHLLDTSEIPGTMTFEVGGKTFHIPTGRFDNRVDKTSFIRKDRADWSDDEVKGVYDGIKSAMDEIWKNYPPK